MSMVEKGALQEEAKQQARRSEAEGFIKEKHLWLVPTWGCNRDETKDNRGICAICFAKDIMHHAGANGYRDPQADFYEKASALTKLPWKDVILTGGEPTLNRESLKRTLAVIDPQSNVRIITNGDWILKEESGEEVTSIIKSSGLKIRVEVSAHDPFEVFKRKIEGLKEKGIEIGSQFRSGEDFIEKSSEQKVEDYYKKAAFAEEVGNREDHKILELGLAVKSDIEYVVPRGVRRLGLGKLMGYTDRDKNVGMYLMPGINGSRVVANHETPYLVFSTPADIVNPNDSPQDAVEKVINFYAEPSVPGDILDNNTIVYAKAAFMAGVPLYIYDALDVDFARTVNGREKFIAGAKKLMDVYYELASKKLQVPVDELKRLITDYIAETVSRVVENGYNPRIASVFNHPIITSVAGSRHLLLSLSSEQGKDYFIKTAGYLFQGNLERAWSFDVSSLMKDPNFLGQLDILDIPHDNIQKRLLKH